MKHFIYSILLLIIAGAAGCTATSPPPKSDKQRILISYDNTGTQEIQRMQPQESDQPVQVGGKEYHLYLSRMPSDSLPHVQAPDGKRYADNEISLRITRGNERIFDRRLTKHVFASLVDAASLEKVILEGMAYDTIAPEGFVYAVGLSYPQTDLHLPVSIIINTSGKMIVRTDTLAN